MRRRKGSGVTRVGVTWGGNTDGVTPVFFF